MPPSFNRQQKLLAASAFLRICVGLICASAVCRDTKAAQPLESGRPRWHVLETANFRVFCYGHRAADPLVGEACENIRARLTHRWLDAERRKKWSPRCDVVLHPNDASYLREVGNEGSSTIASALTERLNGQVRLRRIDVRSTRDGWMTDALPHEMTHIVLADRFVTERLPRWIDEGVAILADSDDKRRRHAHDLHRAVTTGSHFRLAEMLSLADYPPPGRWGTFYDQSAVLVEFLVQQQGPGKFANFVELAMDNGYEHAFEEVYGCGVADFEKRWHRSMTHPSIQTLGGNTDPGSRLAPRRSEDS